MDKDDIWPTNDLLPNLLHSTFYVLDISWYHLLTKHVDNNRFLIRRFSVFWVRTIRRKHNSRVLFKCDHMKRDIFTEQTNVQIYLWTVQNQKNVLISFPNQPLGFYREIDNVLYLPLALMSKTYCHLLCIGTDSDFMYAYDVLFMFDFYTCIWIADNFMISASCTFILKTQDMTFMIMNWRLGDTFHIGVHVVLAQTDNRYTWRCIAI